MSVNYKALDPGIRDIVRQLNEAGFETTDSGDGYSKPPLACVLPFPHVAIKSSRDALIEDADRVYRWLAEHRRRARFIQATYDPKDQSAIVFVGWREIPVARRPAPPAEMTAGRRRGSAGT